MSKNTLLPSLAEPSRVDYQKIDKNLALEREWYKNEQRYQNLGEIALAKELRNLVELKNSDNVQRIRRFEGRFEGFIPYLTPRAVRAVLELTNLWLEFLPEEQINQKSDLRLSVTSMTRHQTYQNKIAADPRKLAVYDSTHCTGNAFDIDASAYYQVNNKGECFSVSDPRRHNGQQKINKEIKSCSLDSSIDTPIWHGYKKEVTNALLYAAQEMTKNNAINLVEEFSDTENACLHIAVNPDY